MGKLKSIFRSLLGLDDDTTNKPVEQPKPAEPPKPTPQVSPSYSGGNQSYSPSPNRPVETSRPDPMPQARVEPRIEPKPVIEQKQVEAPIRTPQSAPVAVPPEPAPQPEVVAAAPTPIYQPQVVEQPFTPPPPPPPPEMPPAFVESPAQNNSHFVTEEPVVEPIEEPVFEVTVSAASTEMNFFDEVVDDFDKAFDEAFSGSESPFGDDAAPIPTGQVQHDEGAIQDLFANIAANYARPVKNFVFELRRGTATKEWIEICRPALRSISRAAESMELTNAAKRMIDFDEALSLAQTSEERVLTGEIRDLILTSYEELVEVLPQTFVIGEEEQQREGIIINSLLKQIPDLGRVTFEKLYGAGLTSLDTLFLAKKEDLAAATGIPLWLCERICNKFQQYREELEGTPRDVAQSGYRSKLIELVDELRRQHEGFERASAQEWSNPALAADKRKFRQNRQACVLQINVVLAEMGELDLVNEIQKLSFDRRIQRLDEYLQSTAGMM